MLLFIEFYPCCASLDVEILRQFSMHFVIANSPTWLIRSSWNFVHSRMLRSKKNWPGDLDLWPWKSIGFQILLRTKYMYVPSLVKIHWRMLILECSQGCYAVIFFLTQWPWPWTGYATNVHIFILGSCNVQSLMNFWLIWIWNTIDFQGHQVNNKNYIRLSLRTNFQIFCPISTKLCGI
jgi:hypothetical protein